MDTVLLLARLFLAGVFALSGITKLADPEGSRKAVAGFGVPDRFAMAGGIALPLVELMLAVLLLPVATAWWGALGGLLLLLGFLAGIVYNLRQGKTPDCHCFGKVHSEPIGPATIVRDGIFAAVALLIVLFGWDDAGTSTIAWFQDMSNWNRVLTIAAGLIVAAVIAESWLLFQIVNQNGRLLLRLDSIDRRLSGVELPESELETESVTPAPAAGLPVGSEAPSFQLKGVFGEPETLESLLSRGNPTMLVFSSPTCGPCNALMPEIGTWQRTWGDRLTIAVVGQGDEAANRAKTTEHDLEHVLLQNSNEVSKLYESRGTPAAVLINPDGTIASGIAPGAEAIRTLVRTATAHLPARAPVRAAGASAPSNGSVTTATAEPRPAPEIALPDLEGNTVSLADFGGSPTAVLFWNPSCGYCRRMLDDLKAWEAAPPADAPKLLVVSTGTVEANREQGIQSTIVLDEGFRTGRAFGVSGTPSAVLVDENGAIAGAAAVGATKVLAVLSGEELAPEPPAASPSPRFKLNLGDPAPEITLPDLEGNEVVVDFTGKRTMVLFWSPLCGFCKRMIHEIRAFEKAPPPGAPELLIVSNAGDIEQNKEAGFTSRYLLGSDFTAGRSYGANGTPSAILVDEEGRIAQELVSGPNRVYEVLGHAPVACQQCLDECDRNGGGAACRTVCEMGGQCA